MAVARIFDLLVALLVLLWVQSEWVHGPDVRRSLVIVIGFAFYYSTRFSPQLRNKSLTLSSIERLSSKLLASSHWRWSILLLCCGIAVAISTLQALALRFPLYDVGIFHQVLWSLNNGLGFHSTISKAGNFILDHFCPSLALFVPLFKLSNQSPLFLPILNPILIFTGVAAWVYFAEKKKNPTLALGALLFGIHFQSLWDNLSWGFHLNTIAFASGSWLLTLILLKDEKKKWLSFTLLIITAFSKEIFLLYGGLLSLSWALFRKKDRFSILLILLSFLFFVSFVIFQKIPAPADKNYFVRYYSYLGSDLPSFIKSAIFSPDLIIENVGIWNLLSYVKTVFLPWLGLPIVLLFKRKREALFLMAIIPSFTAAALSTYPALRDPRYQYVLELWPTLSLLTLFALHEIKSSKLIIAWSGLSMILMSYDLTGLSKEFLNESSKMNHFRNKISQLSSHESIIASPLVGTWTANRKNMTQWPDTTGLNGQCPQWIILSDSDLHDIEKQKDNDAYRCIKKSKNTKHRFESWSLFRIIKDEQT